MYNQVMDTNATNECAKWMSSERMPIFIAVMFQSIFKKSCKLTLPEQSCWSLNIGIFVVCFHRIPIPWLCCRQRRFHRPVPGSILIQPVHRLRPYRSNIDTNNSYSICDHSPNQQSPERKSNNIKRHSYTNQCSPFISQSDNVLKWMASIYSLSKHCFSVFLWLTPKW